MSGVGISEVGDADLREFLLKTIVAKKLTMNVQGNIVTIPRALTENAKKRNTAIFSTVELLKKEGVRESDTMIN